MRHAQRWGLKDPSLVDILLPISEVLKFDESNSISLFIYEGRWAYCMSILYTDAGRAYGPLLKFSDPYCSRQVALEAAVAEVGVLYKNPVCNAYNKSILSWAKSLITPSQLSLF